MRKRIALSLLVLGVGLLASLAVPARAGTETFKLNFEVVLEDLYTDVDNNSSKFEEYRDLDSGFRIPWLRIEGMSQDGDRYLDVGLRNTSRADGRYQLEYGVAGRYDLFVDYNKIPHRFGNDARLLWGRTGPGRYELADPVQQALQGAVVSQFAADRAGVNFDFLDGLLAPYIETASQIDVGLQRDRTLIRAALNKGGKVAWGVELTHENRVGNRPFGSSFGFNNVTELPEPIDYDTDGALLSGEWAGQRGVLSFGYRYSRFENNISTLIWDNPFRFDNATDGSAYLAPGSSSINGSSAGFADLAPSNDADSLFLAGRWKLGGEWRLSGSANYSKMTQDDPLLPYTLNSAIVGVGFDGAELDPTDPANLPARRADRQAEVLSLNADLGTRLAAGWKLNLRYRYYNYDNSSRDIEFPGYVRFHAVWEAVPRVTVPYSYKKQDLGVELGWEASANTNLGFGYTRETWDRDFREVSSSDEDIFRLTLDSKPNAKVSLRGKLEHADRSIDAYSVEAQLFSFLDEEEQVNNLPGLRKYDEAARRYDLVDVSVQLFPRDDVQLYLGVSDRRNDYDESDFGLLKDDITEYSAELSYNPTEKVTFYLFGNVADRESDQKSRQSGGTLSTNPIDDWGVLLNETNTTVGLGWSGSWSGSWRTELTGVYSRSDGEADFTAVPGGAPLGSRSEAADIANYEDIELTSLQLTVGYAITTNVAASVWYRYEDFTIDSFILQGLKNYLPGALLLNGNQGDYTAHLVAGQLKFKF